MLTRTIDNREVAAIGMGCWAIGGEAWDTDGSPIGWGKVDDQESIAAIHAGIDAGLTFIDTADIYGAGHSEVVIGKALKNKRNTVFLATKFGFQCDTTTKKVIGPNADLAYIRSACEASLKRLATDHIDLYQFHLNDYDPQKAEEVMALLEELVTEGKIRSYGWSTDFPDRAEVFAKGEHCVSMQYQYNLCEENANMVAFVEKHNLIGINRGPLAMGLLSGKYSKPEQLSTTDIRRQTPQWLTYFKDGIPTQAMVDTLNAVRDILTSDGRSSVQGALAWILAKSNNNLPIPGFRNPHQITHNAKTLSLPPITRDQLVEIDKLLDR